MVAFLEATDNLDFFQILCFASCFTNFYCYLHSYSTCCFKGLDLFNLLFLGDGGFETGFHCVAPAILNFSL